MQNRLSQFQASRFATVGLHFRGQHRVHDIRYRHILVSTSLNVADRAALVLGFELALLHQSRLSVLHVLRHRKPKRDTHGLDAIGLLHAAADELFGASRANLPGETALGGLRGFIEGTVPPRLLEAVCWSGISRGGDLAESIVTYVNDAAADLVILTAKPVRWWQPMAPFAQQIIERRTRANVIVIRGQTPNRGADRETMKSAEQKEIHVSRCGELPGG